MELLVHDDIYDLKYEVEVHEEMKKNKRDFKNKFSKDKLFWYRFMYDLDQHFQRFLDKCLALCSVVDVDPSYCEMSCVTQSFMHFYFSFYLPNSF